MATSTDIVNQAIQLIGDNQPPVTGVAPSFDSSPAGVAAATLYGPCIATVGRQFGFDFSRNTAALSLSGNTPVALFTLEYLYPTNGIQVRQLIPGSIVDPNNPVPTNWVVANTLVGGIQRKVIQTSVVGALAVFTNQPTEDTWDPEFREAVVRLLASELAMALAGKPDSARDLFDQAGQFEQIAATRDD